MRLVRRISLRAFVLLCFIGFWKQTQAANPADLTSFYRIWPPFYQVAVEQKSQFVYISQPVGPKVSLEIYELRSRGEQLHEVGITTKVSDRLQLGLVQNASDAGPLQQSLMVDFQDKRSGLGMLIPLERDGRILFGPRLKITSRFSVCATLAENQRPLTGLTYCQGRRTILLAKQEHSWWFRVSKQQGYWLPELRYKQTGDESVFGVSLAYIK